MSAPNFLETLRAVVSGGESACLTGTPMIPLHRDTVESILDFIESRLGRPGCPPKAICGYPLQGWRLHRVEFDQPKGQPDGWIVSLHRERLDWRMDHRSFCVMARSDVGPLEAWDEALRIAVREDAREAERASAIEAQRAATPQSGAVHESATAQPGCPNNGPLSDSEGQS